MVWTIPSSNNHSEHSCQSNSCVCTSFDLTSHTHARTRTEHKNTHTHTNMKATQTRLTCGAQRFEPFLKMLFDLRESISNGIECGADQLVSSEAAADLSSILIRLQNRESLLRCKKSCNDHVQSPRHTDNAVLARTHQTLVCLVHRLLGGMVQHDFPFTLDLLVYKRVTGKGIDSSAIVTVL